MASALDGLLSLLAVAQWPLRSQCKVTRSRSGLAFQRGAMQATATELEGGFVGVVYEHAPHEVTRERGTPAQAARLLWLVFHRERLMKVEGPF